MSPKLNPAQREAVLTRQGPLLVLAGAGTGKTRVVTHRIGELIRSGLAAERILAVTFTNKAALEMQERIGKLLGGRRNERPSACTFHSHCVRILRRHASRLGYPDRFAICDRGDQESVARDVLLDLRGGDQALRPADLLMAIGSWKCRGIAPSQAESLADTDRHHLAAMGYRRYQQSLRNSGAVDFDDLLMLTEQLFDEHADALALEAGRFDHLLIDEYQDTNGSQYRIVRALALPHRNLCVVGDDDQSIYAWRGAEVAHILNFRRDWPDAKVVRLVENYRSTEAILGTANRLIAFNTVRHEKQLVASRPGGAKPRILQFKSEEEEAREIATEIQRLATAPGASFRDYAILFRTNEHARPFELALRKRTVPYVLVGASSFFDRKEVKDLTAYMRAALHPKEDTAVLRILNTPRRGIGDQTSELIRKHAVEARQAVWDTLHDDQFVRSLPSGASQAVAQFRDIVAELGRKLGGRGGRSEALKELIRRVNYESEIDRSRPDPQERDARWQLVEELVNSVASFEKENEGGAKFSDFLDEIALGQRDFGDSKEKELKRDAVVMMTAHSAKGLEFPHVYLPGMEENRIPHHRSALDDRGVEEERRLCYVAVTRAQETLTFSLALQRMKWGKSRDTIPSRFLFEAIGQAQRARDVAKAVAQAR